MQTINCLIVDDDDVFVEKFSEQLEKLGFMKIAAKSKTYSETAAALKSNAIDLIFLDINLDSIEGLNGFDILRQQPHLPPVIIITSLPNHAIESYEIGIAKDFLVKPIDIRRLTLAINRALDTNIESQQFIDDKSIFLKMGRRFQRFFIEDIDFIEGYGIYAKVNTQGLSHVINDSLTNIEKVLDSKKFLRVHKSFIINLNKLVGFDHNKIYLKNGSVPVGASYKNKLGGLYKLFDNEL